MKILNAHQLKVADAFTIAHEPIDPIDLMERAATQCADWLLLRNLSGRLVRIFCGKGGNGGDGLAIARLLYNQGVKTVVYILESGKVGSPEFETNRERLQTLPLPYYQVFSNKQFPQLSSTDLIIDALFGFGLDRPLQGLSADLVEFLNASGVEIISIDLPSGLFADASSLGNTTIRASHTLTFECYKLALLVTENAAAIGEVHILPIQLHKGFLDQLETDFEATDETLVKRIFKPRNRFAHKGTYGHSLIVGGSYGKIGAILLATMACLRSGAGLVTTYLPQCGYEILQSGAPEAMTITDVSEKTLSQPPPAMDRFNAFGIGPGMGLEEETGHVLRFIINHCKKPLVLDADALNSLKAQPELLAQLFQNTILTPHPKEFERLFGACVNDFQRIELAIKKAVELGVIIILKGHHTLIAMPNGKSYFNTTGNAGMAKGGSGDVLTGVLTGLLAQGYPAAHAAILGVYLHGCAGDSAAKSLGGEAMIASDLVTNLSNAFLWLNKKCD